MSHAQGPWEIGDGSDRNLFCGSGDILGAVRPGARGVIARVNTGIADHAANARLIAAAPELADVAMAVSKRPDECKRMFEREGFIFDGTGGRWEKLALSLYTILVIDCEAATEALRKAGEIPGEVGNADPSK